MKDIIQNLQHDFDQAELQGNKEILRKLITDDFLSIGPKGFMLDKDEWINRHDHFSYQAVDISEVDIRLYDRTAIVRNIQRNKATYKNEKVELSVRVSQVWVNNDGQWKIAAIQFSPLAED